jgi:hypothetical protein
MSILVTPLLISLVYTVTVGSITLFHNGAWLRGIIGIAALFGWIVWKIIQKGQHESELFRPKSHIRTYNRTYSLHNYLLEQQRCESPRERFKQQEGHGAREDLRALE